MLLFCCAAYSSGTFTAYADSPAPETPYEIVLQGGDKIFYMTPSSNRIDPGLEVSEERMQVKSGLYYTTPLENIYYVNRYFYQSILLSDDGICFAYIEWASAKGMNDLSGEAIGFYKNGVKIKSYKVSDLLKDKKKADFSVSHVMWEDGQKREYDIAKNTLTVTAKDGCVYAFDIKTGQMIAGSSNVLENTDGGTDKTIIIIAAVCAAAILITVFIIIVFEYHASRKKSEEPF